MLAVMLVIGPLTVLGQFWSLSLWSLPTSPYLYAQVLHPLYQNYQLAPWRNNSLQRRQFQSHLWPCDATRLAAFSGLGGGIKIKQNLR
jgi:hypothetical protein